MNIPMDMMASERTRPRGAKSGEPRRRQMELFNNRTVASGRGAGRPPQRQGGPGSPHKGAGHFLHERYPVHVHAAGGRRRRQVCADAGVYKAVREATLTHGATRELSASVHLSIQHDHIHMLVEAKDKEALAKGMQGFQISAAKHLNAAITKDKPGAPPTRKLSFPDRLPTAHDHHLAHATSAVHAPSAYVMKQLAQAQGGPPGSRCQLGDDRLVLRAAIMFPGWAEYGDAAFFWRAGPTRTIR